MIKEFAFGTHNRHHFQDANKMGDWEGVDSDTFVSLYDYDEHVAEYCDSKNSLSGYDGLIYMPDEFILDIDGSSPLKAQEYTKALLVILKDLDVPYQIYFSGTGFHVGIPSTAFRWKPSKNLHLNVKDALTNAGIFEYADPSVTDKTRIIRLINTKNTKSGLWKVRITEKLLHEDIDNILSKAKIPGKGITDIDMDCNPVFDVLERSNKNDSNEIVSFGRTPDPVNYPCIQKMLAGTSFGNRHMVALRLASWLRWLYPEDIVRLLMEEWRKKVDRPDKPLKQDEMTRLVEGCYTGHGGQGYRYGCNDPVMDKFCSNTCKLYKAKKSQDVLSPIDMEKILMDFYASDLKPVNIGALYGQDFPIYPGEVVILQAPPASMKTMLLQNWITQLKRPTYFIEMEMSPRQIWSRFIMIENGWTEEDLKNHYKQMRNGMDEKFKYLTVDYSPPYANELEKRIMMLPVKPEIVVVDHMGLFKSRQRDANMKVEEASQCLMELAVKHNMIVFAVSEVNKMAMKEGMNIASSRGSFRIAYNANKLLSLKPYKNDEGLIEYLEISSTKNREKEQLQVRLSVDNTRIYKA